LKLCRQLSDAEKRLHEAAKNGKCDEIRALAADGTDMSSADPDNVRYYKTHRSICVERSGSDMAFLSADRPALENDRTGTSAR